MEVCRGSNVDKVQQYINARWICTPKALWKIFRFNLYQIYPSVERLQIHLPNCYQVRFYKYQRITDVLNNDHNSKTMLTQFFSLNRRDPNSRSYLHREILEHYYWHRGIRNGTEEGHLIRETTTIIWDETPMTNKYALETLERLLKDILDCDAPVGGKIMILEGDFRQVLLVVQKGTKAQIIYACIVKSHLWPITKVLHLQQNM
uniref:ATP-dependent DNA helicase n=1 Tax=Cajanus cajan TaxID=3821 RepID=A0A151R6F3_CAJCA|nr:hypothetical protein KK1_040826 [Cajanus cajan]